MTERRFEAREDLRAAGCLVTSARIFEEGHIRMDIWLHGELAGHFTLRSEDEGVYLALAIFKLEEVR